MIELALISGTGFYDFPGLEEGEDLRIGTKYGDAHVNGPRFNSKPEINMLKNYASFISQTAGPEIVLAGELEIPYALLGFGVDYANGVQKEPTPVEVLGENSKKSRIVFTNAIRELIKNYSIPEFTGFIYRFE